MQPRNLSAPRTIWPWKVSYAKETIARGLILASVIGATMLTAGMVSADGGSGVSLGLRLGYGIPMGELKKDDRVSEGFKGQVPIWIDAGYKINPNIYVGLF